MSWRKICAKALAVPMQTLIIIVAQFQRGAFVRQTVTSISRKPLGSLAALNT